uniref:Olfactory receptor n=1 Tax=Varanus komodoensis TaxID=61221 RepID=A0A8D2KSJ3_VARKO
MAEQNYTTVTEFVLLGFTAHEHTQVVLFVLFLAIYAATVVGNIGLIIVIWMSPSLHSPMYFFLNHLAFLDLSYSSTITPKMLVNFIVKRKTITFGGCIAQMYLFASFADVECLLLAAMAYDRYMAICHPLPYPAFLSHKRCICLVTGCYLTGSMSSLVHTSLTLHLSFCSSNAINHFFCDIPPLLALSCSSTHINEVLLFTLCGFIQSSTFLFILISYACILSTTLRICSAEGRYKAFSTCTSHLMAVALYYGTLLFMYVRPSSSYALDTDKIISVFYTVVFPMVNPLIYSLRNREVKDALRRALERDVSPGRSASISGS